MKIPDLKGLDILLMEADSMYAATLSSGLSELGAGVVVASSAEQAAGLLAGGRYTAVISSLDLIDERSIGMLADFKRAHPHALCFLLAEHDYDSVEASHDSVRTIVDDYLKKPVDVRRLARMIQTSLGMPSTGSTSLAVVEPLISRVKPYFLFRSPVMQHALAKLPEIAASGQTVLVTGETGTGKEIVARAIHMLSPRSSGPFVPINCGAIPESLIEGELFGHEKGAFTGAHRSRKGKFESADGGTLFLDEIADMPPDLQGRLLRVLEEGRVYRVGGERAIPIDVRVIAATRVALEKAVDGGLFRDDLFYRLNVLRINLPPLRERTEDIPLLAAHFLERALVSMGRTSPFPIL